jgi:hypothetical protein
LSTVRKLLAVLGLAVVLVLGLSSQAFASPSDPPPSGPSDPRVPPDPNATYVGPHVPPPYEPKPTPCGFFGIGSFRYDLSTPEDVHPMGPALPADMAPTVVGHPAVEVTNNTSCSVGQVQFNIQRYKCDWHCHWNTEKESDVIMLPKSGRIQSDFTIPCRPGTNRYRVTAKVNHVEISVEDTGSKLVPYAPKLETVPETEQSPELSATC